MQIGVPIDYSKKGQELNEYQQAALNYTLTAGQPPHNSTPTEKNEWVNRRKVEIMKQVKAEHGEQAVLKIGPEIEKNLKEKASFSLTDYVSGRTKDPYLAASEYVDAVSLADQYAASAQRWADDSNLAEPLPPIGAYDNLQANHLTKLTGKLANTDAAVLAYGLKPEDNVEDLIKNHMSNERITNFLSSFEDANQARVARFAYETELREKVAEFQGRRAFNAKMVENSQGLVTVDFDATRENPYILNFAPGVSDNDRATVESAIDGAIANDDYVDYNDVKKVFGKSPILSQMMAWHQQSPTPASGRLFGTGPKERVLADQQYHGIGSSVRRWYSKAF